MRVAGSSAGPGLAVALRSTGLAVLCALACGLLGLSVGATGTWLMESM
jgi:hypothetical protein